MPGLRPILVVSTALALVSCDTLEPDTGATNAYGVIPSEGQVEMVSVGLTDDERRELERERADLRTARERRFARIVKMHPELASDAVLADLVRGDWIGGMMAMEKKYADVAPLYTELIELALMGHQNHLNR